MGSVHQADEVDAVSYDNGAWIQIVADDGTKGYINAYYAIISPAIPWQRLWKSSCALLRH